MSRRLMESISTEYARLLVEVANLRALADALEQARPTEEEQALEQLRGTIAVSQSFRSQLEEAALLLVEDSSQSSSSGDLAVRVEGVLKRLDRLVRFMPLVRLKKLSHALARGSIRSEVGWRFSTLDGRHRAAAREVRERLDQESDLASFPGPEDLELDWLAWFWDLADGAEAVVEELHPSWPSLVDFLATVDQGQWDFGPSADEPVLDDEDEPSADEPALDDEDEPSADEPVLDDEDEPSADEPVLDDEDEPSADEPVLDDEDEPSADEPALDDEDEPSADEPVLDDEDEPSADEPALDDEKTVPKPVVPAEPPIPFADLLPQSPVTCAAMGLSESELTMIREAGDDEDDCETPGGDPLVGSVKEPTPENHGEAAPPPTSHQTDMDAAPSSSWCELDDWIRERWVDLTGAVELAPWTRADFEDRIVAAQEECLVEGRWGEALLLARAGRALGGELHGLMTTDELLLLAHLPAGTRDPDEDQAVELATWLVGHVQSSEINSRPRDKARVVLTVLSSRSSDVPESLLQDALAFAGFSQPFMLFLRGWQRFVRSTSSPCTDVKEMVRERQGAEAPDPQQQLKEAHKGLREALKRLTSAAGGNIQRTHCRDAWDAFMKVAHPVISHLLDRPDDDANRTRLGRLEKKAEDIFDRGGTKFQDRRQMDKAVEEFLMRAHTLIKAHDARAAGVSNRPSGPEIPPQVMGPILGHSLDGLSPDEAWLMELVRGRILADGSAAVELAFPVELIAQHPGILSTFQCDSFDEGLDVRTFEAPLVAAVHLLSEPVEASLDTLREWLASHRPDLLARLPEPTESERVEAGAALQKLRDELDEAVSAARGILLDLQALADTVSVRLRQALQRVEPEASVDALDPRLQLDWVRHVMTVVRARVDWGAGHLSQRAIQEGAEGDEVRRLVERRRFSDLHCLVGADERHGDRDIRATPFRRDALDLFPNPERSLQRHRGQPDNAYHKLVEVWLKAGRDPGKAINAHWAKDLRKHFVEVAFDVEEKKRKSKVVKLAASIRIACSTVLAWLQEEKDAPTFLPQLSRYRDLYIKMAPTAVSAPALPRMLASMVEDGSLTIVLAPGLPADRREECLGVLHNRSIALLDTLDLCRLLNPGRRQPSLVEALLEMTMEQQSWKDCCPYEIQEGQHVRMEMYVGRRQDAERLVTSSSYSRIFSGRRLGKTALLRYVEHVNNDRVLPSGNRLQVLYLPIVGLESEDAVVDEVLRGIGERLEIDFEPSEGVPSVRLELGIRQALAHQDTVSLLVFLDEADTFFESQLADAAHSVAGFERALSWHMRKLESIKDSNGLPRVRFVFCGYRQTNRSEGAWANWGDVLLLKPLEVDDAVSLVAGPLARLGIDARERVDVIAFRCGYQPALIIRFCLELVHHLEREIPRQRRDHVVVTREHVDAVFYHDQVQDAVREVCWLNFVGNPAGQLVFAAFLKELQNRPPAAMVDDAPRRLLKRVSFALRDEASDEWVGGRWQDLATRQLRELVSRSLLVEPTRFPQTFRLRFTPHRPALLAKDPDSRIRDAHERLRAVRSGGVNSSWIVTDDVLENARWLHSDPTAREMGCRAVFFGTHWPAPLLNEHTGLGFRLAADEERGGSKHDLRSADAAEFTRILDRLGDEGALPVVVGGAKALRWAVEVDEVEVMRLGRLGFENIQGWFQRIRGIEFTGSRVLERVLERTGGIPLLVGKLDRALTQRLGEEGATVDGSTLDGFLEDLERALPTLAQALVSGPPNLALSQRELELLQLVVVGSTEYSEPEDLVTFLSDVELWERGSAIEDLAPIGPGDDVPLRVLLELGLLPRGEAGGARALDELLPLAASDPVVKIVRAMVR